jgi:hypothetical protein
MRKAGAKGPMAQFSAKTRPFAEDERFGLVECLVWQLIPLQDLPNSRDWSQLNRAKCEGSNSSVILRMSRILEFAECLPEISTASSADQQRRAPRQLWDQRCEGGFGNVVIATFFPDGVVTGNWLESGYPSRYPSGNYFDGTFVSAFINWSSGDFLQRPGGPLDSRATDASHIGANIPLLSGFMQTVISGSSK